MTKNYEDIRDELKAQPLDELKRQRAHHFQGRSLSSTDRFELYNEEIKHRERLTEENAKQGSRPESSVNIR